MKRREFICLVSGAAAWPLAARAQQPAKLPIIGYLSSSSLEASQYLLNDFRKGLAESGFFEDKNVNIEYRWADGHYDRLPALAEELVSRKVQVIATSGGSASAFAAHNATTTIPIVSGLGADPVKSGLVTSLNRPAGNLTGVAQLLNDADGKRLEILHELVPAAKTIGYLANPKNERMDAQRSLIEEIAAGFGVNIRVLNATSKTEIDAAFAVISSDGISAILVGADAFLFISGNQIVALAAANSVPVMYFFREHVRAGGLISYGTRLGDALHQLGVYSGRILAGAKPVDLPIVQQSEKIELSINLKTARSLGLTVPTSLLLRADEVIE